MLRLVLIINTAVLLCCILPSAVLGAQRTAWGENSLWRALARSPSFRFKTLLHQNNYNFDPNSISLDAFGEQQQQQQQPPSCLHSNFFGHIFDDGDGGSAGSTSNNFEIVVHGNPSNYEPGASYQVTLQGRRTAATTSSSSKQFKGFALRVIPAASSSFVKSAGYFSLLEASRVKFWHTSCRNVVVNATAQPVNDVHVSWTAPATPMSTTTDSSKSCVRIQALVHNTVAYSQTEILERMLCQAPFPTLHVGTFNGGERSNGRNSPAALENSATTSGGGHCPCDTAKYRVFFDGMWSKTTHPYSFPAEENFVHFSNVIGASHTDTFRLWQMGGRATPGLRKLAMYGITDALEQELKQAPQSEIHTIIEMDGLWFPETSGGASRNAIFRADRRRHLVSLASMIGPSPDWLVGVDSVDMCNGRGQWLDDASALLYPFDAGVDRGETFLSRDEPLDEPIHNLTGPPFYRRDTNGQPIPSLPLARVRFQLLRTYPRACDAADSSSTNIDGETDGLYSNFVSETKLQDLKSAELPVCRVSDWSPWSACTAICDSSSSGGGIQNRTRQYLNPWKAKVQQCARVVGESQSCQPSKQQLMSLKCSTVATTTTTLEPMMSKTAKMAKTTSVRDTSPSALPLTAQPSSSLSSSKTVMAKSPQCMTSPWSQWSSCSADCGQTGLMQRTRMLKNSSPSQLEGGAECANVSLVETAKCFNTCFASAVADSSTNSNDDPCSVAAWSTWSVCSVTCGAGGLQYRSRQFLSARKSSQAECQSTVPTFEIRNCSNVVSCDLNELDAARACMLPRRPGPCRGYFPRFFYDSERKACLNFVYGGCRGNDNNFRSFEECRRNCENRFDILHGMSLTKLVNLPMASSPDYGPISSVSYDVERFMLKPNVICVDQNQLAPDTVRQLQNDRGFNLALRHAASAGTSNGSGGSSNKASMMPADDGSSNISDLSAVDMAAAKAAMMNKNNKNMMNNSNQSQDCIVSDWGEWSQCSVSCGKGTQFRMRKVMKPSSSNVAPEDDGNNSDAVVVCRQESKEMRNCRQQPCPIDCKMSNTFGEWTQCSRTCGRGIQERVQRIENYPRRGGRPCPPPKSEIRLCKQLPPCPLIML